MPLLLNDAAVVKLRPSRMLKLPELMAMLLTAVKVEPAPSKVTLAAFVLRMPLRVNVAPAKALQLPPVKVLPETWATLDVRLTVPEWASRPPVLLKGTLIVEVFVPANLLTSPALLKRFVPPFELMLLSPWKLNMAPVALLK